jgi:hypothetical protein
VGARIIAIEIDAVALSGGHERGIVEAGSGAYGNLLDPNLRTAPTLWPGLVDLTARHTPMVGADADLAAVEDGDPTGLGVHAPIITRQ